MPRAQSKQELITQSEQSFTKLWQCIDAMSELALATEFDFSHQPNKKEQHWQRDRNLRDVLIHLYEWHQLLINWIESNLSGKQAPFLPEPYNWKTYAEMNIAFWQKHQATSLAKAIQLLKQSHDAALACVRPLTDEALFDKGYFSWTGTTTLGSYCVSAMPSHYEWALKKLRAHVKQVS